MQSEVRVLQLGPEDYSQRYELPRTVHWEYELSQEVRAWIAAGREDQDVFEYDVILIGRKLTEEEARYLLPHARAYSVFVEQGVEQDGVMEQFLGCTMGEVLEMDPATFIATKIRDYYSTSYGEKYSFQNFVVANTFQGSVQYSGYEGVTLEGDFGREFCQIGYFRNTIPFFQDTALEFWLEYQRDEGVEIQLELVNITVGSVDTIQDRWTISNDMLSSQKKVIIENDKGNGSLFLSIQARGQGRLQLVNLHDRWSRRSMDDFIPGGKRILTKGREEVFYYYHPGNGRPPLNVYFAGYATREGFEGYGLMRSLKGPFLLISDRRLEGGAFYMGDQEYEDSITGIIRRYMALLGFSEKELVLSGISMGSTGALYYGAKLHAKYIVVGKPLTNLGSIAERERIMRPGVYPTSIDVLKKNETAPTAEAIANFNQRFWENFDQADWSDTTFAVSYMIEDDYDGDAYQSLLRHLDTKGAKVYGRGLHGRHNDNSHGIAKWFIRAYRHIIEVDYERGEYD